MKKKKINHQQTTKTKRWPEVHTKAIILTEKEENPIFAEIVTYSRSKRREKGKRKPLLLIAKEDIQILHDRSVIHQNALSIPNYTIPTEGMEFLLWRNQQRLTSATRATRIAIPSPLQNRKADLVAETTIISAKTHLIQDLFHLLY